MSERIPIYYTFGNHHHWVDMEWLWGYKVTPDSVRDMLYFCRETGAKGNVNFDGVGYEKMAAECPEALAELREAIANGQIEPVGCSYGQPYGLFHGGESNIRQRVYGVRAVMRLLGTRPRTFWEEEFDFFPQLPQILKGCGFENASLYFQWTWHTPEVPKEDVPVVWWEAPDGSRLLTATRNRLNLHQWPEDFQILLNEIASQPPTPEHQKPNTPLPLILQWLELIPSPDWMCRAELMIPMLKKLLADERFEVKMGTLGEYLGNVRRGMAVPAKEFKGASGMTVPVMRPAGVSPVEPEQERDAPGTHDRADHATHSATDLASTIPVRRYTMDQVWHGMSLGKNGDRMRRNSYHTEAEILRAESLSATLGLFGRPYAQWDVYPTWEIEECWRNLLMAQHHDNDECEGLCGYVGHSQYETSWNDAAGIFGRQIDRLAKHLPQGEDEIIVCNPLGWDRSWHVVHRDDAMTTVTVPAFGWTLVPEDARDVDIGSWTIEGKSATFRRGGLHVLIDLEALAVTQLANSDFPDGLPQAGSGLWQWCGSDSAGRSLSPKVIWDEGSQPKIEGERMLRVRASFEHHPDSVLKLRFFCEPHIDGLFVEIEGDVPRPKPGLNASFGCVFNLAESHSLIQTDEPLSVTDKKPTRRWHKKYPEGDWMTSTQWFEEVRRPFTSWCLADFQEQSGAGLLIAHDGSRQWFLEEGAKVRHVLHMYDPWDEERDCGFLENRFLLLPHAPLSKSQKWKLAQEAMRDCFEELAGAEGASFSPLHCAPSNVVPTAFYREEEYYAGRDLEHYAGRGMGHPFVIRLVEFDGLESDVELTLPGPIAKAFKTNLMGELEVELEPVEGRSPSLVLRSETEVGDGGGDPGSRGSQNLHPPAPSSSGAGGGKEGNLHPQPPPPLASGVAPRGGGSFPFSWQTLRFKMRPYEIATVYADLVPGRKQFRDLDAMRKVWATVHRVEE